MNLYKLETGNFKLDGGAMFGVVPKVLWNKVYPSDENNLCTLSMRCLLVKTTEKLILIDTGIGNKQSEKFFGFYYRENIKTLEKSIQEVGFKLEQITDVILTHLHFDHCGGAVTKNSSGNFELQFPNADYWVSESQWNWSQSPNQREKASYLKENIEPLFESGKLKFIQNEGFFCNVVYLRLFNGHSEGVIVPIIGYRNKKLVFMGDLIPTTAHIPLSWVCGFDTRPMISMQERESFLKEAVRNKYIFFFEHDVYNECCSLTTNEKGVCVKDNFRFEDFINS